MEQKRVKKGHDVILPFRAAYICDQKLPCASSPGCQTDCKRTTDVNHALNGPVVNVREWHERFELIDYNNELTHWEIDKNEKD